MDKLTTVGCSAAKRRRGVGSRSGRTRSCHTVKSTAVQSDGPLLCASPSLVGSLPVAVLPRNNVCAHASCDVEKVSVHTATACGADVGGARVLGFFNNFRGDSVSHAQD